MASNYGFVKNAPKARKGKPDERPKANTRQTKHVTGDKRERFA